MPFSRRLPGRRQVPAQALPLCQPLEPRRLLSAGELDRTFGGDGKVTVDIPGSLSESTLAPASRTAATPPHAACTIDRYAASTRRASPRSSRSGEAAMRSRNPSRIARSAGRSAANPAAAAT